MKKGILFFIISLCLGEIAFSQNTFDDVIIDNTLSVGSTEEAATSSILDIESTTLGLLIPRMTTVQRDAIVTPANGLIVYNTDDTELNFYNGSTWGSIGGGSNFANADLTLDGNRTHSLNGFNLDIGSMTLEAGDKILTWDNGTNTQVNIEQGGADRLKLLNDGLGGQALFYANGVGLRTLVYYGGVEIQNSGAFQHRLNYQAVSYLNGSGFASGKKMIIGAQTAFGTEEISLQGYVGIQGNGSTSATTAFFIENNSGTQALNVTNDTKVTVSSGLFNIGPISAATASGLTAVDGDFVYVNTTDATFTSVGFWGYENGTWVKL